MYVHNGHERINKEIDSHTTKIRRAFRSLVPFWKILGESMLVDVRVILLVEGDTTGEYLHPHIELETLRIYTVITLFLPPGFSWVSKRKTRQPGQNWVNPTGVRHIKRTSRRGPEHISQSLGRFDQVWPRFDQGVDQSKNEIWLTNP